MYGAETMQHVNREAYENLVDARRAAGYWVVSIWVGRRLVASGAFKTQAEAMADVFVGRDANERCAVHPPMSDDEREAFLARVRPDDSSKGEPA